MIPWCTSSIPKEDVVFPRLLYCDSRCFQTCCRRSQGCFRCSPVLPCLSLALPGLLSVFAGLSSALRVPLKASRNVLLESDTLLKLTHLTLHSTSSQTLLEASSDLNTFCWCSQAIKTGWYLDRVSSLFPFCSHYIEQFKKNLKWLFASFLMSANS